MYWLALSDTLFKLSGGHVPKIAEWTKKYGDVIRVSLGEREAVCFLLCFDVLKYPRLTRGCLGHHQQQ